MVIMAFTGLYIIASAGITLFAARCLRVNKSPAAELALQFTGKSAGKADVRRADLALLLRASSRG